MYANSSIYFKLTRSAPVTEEEAEFRRLEAAFKRVESVHSRLRMMHSQRRLGSGGAFSQVPRLMAELDEATAEYRACLNRVAARWKGSDSPE